MTEDEEIVLRLRSQLYREGVSGDIGVSPLREGMRYSPTRCMCGGGCESLLECAFWYQIRKTSEGENFALRQVSIGPYRVDSLFDCAGDLVAVELDGAAYHDPDEDAKRDAILLRWVDRIIRIPYAAMTYFPHATMRILSQWHGRFALRAYDIFCVSEQEFRDEMDVANGRIGEDGYEFADIYKWLDWADPNYEIWKIDSRGRGFAMSPKAYLYTWNVKPIRRFNRGEATA